MKRLLKWLFIAALVGAAVAAVKSAKEKKEELTRMSDDEIRALIESKLGDKVPPENLGQIQDAVVRGAAKMRGTAAVVAEQAAEVADDAAEVAEDAAEIAEDAADVAAEAADEATDDLT